MTLKSLIDSDVTNVFLNTDEFAESVTYTPADGTGTSINAVVEREQAIEQDGLDGRHVTKTAMIFADSGDVSAPSFRDEFTFDGKTWKVSRLIEQPEFGGVLLEVERVERIETSSPDYRITR